MYWIHLAKVAGSHSQIHGPEYDNTVRIQSPLLGNTNLGSVKGFFKILQPTGLTSVNKRFKTIGTWLCAR